MPHIGKIYGTEVEGGVLFVATVPPQATLASHIEKFHTCPATGEDFCRALIQSLEVLHGANIANKNIRPEHIVLDGCNVQLADFSHAKAFESDAASAADFIIDKHMLACTILYTLSGGLDADGDQVRKTPSWPRSWANFSRLLLYSHRNAWANLDLLGPT